MRHQLLGLFVLAGMLLAPLAFAGDAEPWPPWLTERKVLGKNGLEPIEKALGTPIYGETRGIARVESVEEGLAFCTATRVSKDLFITNFHCYDFKPCDKVQFHLAFEHDIPPEQQLLLRCKGVLSKSLLHDYALFQVEPCGKAPSSRGVSPPQSPEGAGDATPTSDVVPDLDRFPIATLWNGPISVGQRVFLAGYPGARPKEVDRSLECILRTVVPELLEERRTITHNCDTEGGSSGSPLMDFATGYIVGLHWGGTDRFNMAIPIKDVIADLKVQLPAEVFAELQIADKAN